MRSTNNLNVNASRTLLILLGIVVAVLLTMSSGMLGDTASLTNDLYFFSAGKSDTSEVQEIGVIETASQLFQTGKSVYLHINELINQL